MKKRHAPGVQDAKWKPDVSQAITKRLLFRLFLLAISIWLAGCGEPEGGPSSAAEERINRPAREAAIPVRTETVERGDMVTYIETYARLEANRQVEVLARTTGLVEEIRVEEGDWVREGAILVQLQKHELDLRVQQAQVALQQVLAGYERNRTLHERRMVSDAEFETVRNQLESAQVNLQEAQLNLAYASIRAPISGVVMQRLIEIGDLVRVNQLVLEMADLEPLLARIPVPEKRMQQIREGQEARVLVESLPGEVFTGRIRMISPRVDPQSGTIRVTLEIPDVSARLKPGTFVSVRIITGRRPQTLMLSRKTLLIGADDDDVFVVREGRARRTRVELGITEGERVEVLAGLEEGDLVVAVGQEGLRDGAAVRVVGAEPLAGTMAGAEEEEAESAVAQEGGARR